MRWLAATMLIAATLSCSRGADRAPNDTGITRDSLRADTTVPVPAFREWIGAAGRYLIVSAGSADSAVVVFPEFTIDSSLASGRLALAGGAALDYDLFVPDGSSARARLGSLTPVARAGCDTWPHASIIPVDSMRLWTIGLSAGRAQGIAYRVLDQLSARDSARIVVDLTRLASLAPNDTTNAFRGLPYVVRSAYTATVADSQTFVLAELVRRVNVEANPHEERITVIAERPMAGAGVPYTLAFSERHVGDEETVPTTELIGLVVLRDGTHAAFAVRDYSDGGTFLMFERDTSARWRLRWQSAYAGC